MFKCLKYELRAYSRSLMPAFFVIMAASLIMFASICLFSFLRVSAMDQMTHSIAQAVLTFIEGVLFISMFAIPIVTFAVTIRRFYASFFTDEGYLTFALPVPVKSMLRAKIIAAIFIDAVSIPATMLAIVVAASGVNVSDYLFYGYTGGLVNTTIIPAIFETLHISDMLAMLNITYISESTLTLAAFAFVIAVISDYVLIYLAITIGSTFARKHRVLVCSAWFLGISSVSSSVYTAVVIGIVLVAASFQGITGDLTMIDIGSLLPAIIVVVSILVIIETSIFHAITKYLLNKKVNLS